MSPIKNQKQLKRNNVKKIILAIKQAKTTSKTQLSKGLGLSFATVSNICNDLMDKGMVWIEESASSTGGRKPADIGLNKNSRYILTLNLSNNLCFEVALLNLHFETISKTRKTFS